MNKKVLSLLFVLVLSLAFAGTVSANDDIILISQRGFSDIEDVEKTEYINELYTKGVIKGDGKGLFLPERIVTRAEAVQIAANIFNSDVKEVNLNSERYYTSIDSNKWYSRAFELARLKGFEFDKEVEPNEQISKQEFVYYVLSAIEKKYTLPYLDTYIEDFSDEEKITNEYRGTLKRAYLYNAVETDDENNINPNEKVNRVKMAEITAKLLRYAEKNNDEEAFKNLYDKLEARLIKNTIDEKQASFQMILENVNSKDITLKFNSGKKYDYTVYDENDNIVYQWSKGKMFTEALEFIELKNNGVLVFNETWDYTDNDGNIVDKGIYKIVFDVEFVIGSEKYMMSDQISVEYGFEKISSKLNAKLEVASQDENQVEFEMALKNISEEALNLEFGSGKKYDYYVYDSNNELVYQWSNGKMFTMAIEYQELNANETLKFNETWDYTDNEGNKVKDGKYTVVFEVELYNDSYRQTVSDEIQIVYESESINSKINTSLEKTDQNEEKIQFEMTLRNVSDEVINMEFSSGKKYDYIVYNSENEIVYQWSNGKMFTMAVEYIELNPSQEITFDEIWDYTNNEGDKVGSGKYRLVFSVQFETDNSVNRELSEEIEVIVE